MPRCYKSAHVTHKTLPGLRHVLFIGTLQQNQQTYREANSVDVQVDVCCFFGPGWTRRAADLAESLAWILRAECEWIFHPGVFKKCP